MSLKRKKGFSFSKNITVMIIMISIFFLFYSLSEKIYTRNVNNKEAVNFYNTLNSALANSIKENGTVDNWDLNSRNPEILFKHLEKYLPVSKDCNINNTGDCIYSGFYKLFNGKPYNNYAKSPIYYKALLSDGSAMWLRTGLKTPVCNEKDGGYDNVCGLIWFDTNSAKAPNTIGEDVFVFVLLNNKIVPYKEASNVESIDGSCFMGGGGWGCAEKILNGTKALKF